MDERLRTLAGFGDSVGIVVGFNAVLEGWNGLIETVSIYTPESIGGQRCSRVKRR
jgi:hypothetical protein